MIQIPLVTIFVRHGSDCPQRDELLEALCLPKTPPLVPWKRQPAKLCGSRRTFLAAITGCAENPVVQANSSRSGAHQPNQDDYVHRFRQI
jgi:hypothetical protein